MLPSLPNLFGRRSVFLTPAPDNPICVIGDVHGCIAQLEMLLVQVPEDHQVILVGDCVDRGEHSAEVLRLISARPEFTCLRGNHEEMLLRFLESPEAYGPRWLRYGGLQTLASFGVRSARAEMSKSELRGCRDALLDAMGDVLCQWVQGLKTSWSSGNVLVTHAGADPNSDPAQQSDTSLVWGHPSFQKVDRRDGVWVVYGHTIVGQAGATRGRIAVDTGAYATGVLSAVCLDGNEPRFLTARP